ncbi:hypothetical protein KKB18_01420, partial [bacterium]|nr:hypothetical protein [bacterium]
KIYKKKITSPEDAQGSFSPQSYMFKLFKEIEDPNTKKMRPLFIPGQYEMIVNLIDFNRKAGEQERGIKYNFSITE